MMKCICLLRGINVGGKRKVKMLDLKELFIQLGLHDPVTYIQSGNVIFDYKLQDFKDLQSKIEKGISEHFGLEVMVQVFSVEQLKNIFSQNPYVNEYDQDKLHFTFLTTQPDFDLMPQLKAQNESEDEFQLKENTIYLYCPNGYGRTKFNNNFFEKKLRVQATTRNWKTVKKMIEMAG